MTVLIVEDEPLVAFDNEHMLTQAGYTVLDTVDSYAHAVEALDRHLPDLVIADVKLSGRRSGVDVAALARKRDIPVLFVTGHCPEQARLVGVACLAKPFAPRDLIAAVRVVDRKSQGKRVSRLPSGLTLFDNVVGNP